MARFALAGISDGFARLLDGVVLIYARDLPVTKLEGDGELDLDLDPASAPDSTGPDGNENPIARV